jgi:PAS domain S-box-containing protein
VAIMLLGQLSGRVMYMLDSLNGRIFSPGESVLVVIGLSCSVYAYALFHFRVLDPILKARSVVIEQMSDGMLVLDSHGIVVDANPAAVKIFGGPASSLVGRAVLERLPPDSGVEVESGRVELTKSEVRFDSGESARYYSLDLTRLLDERGEALGHLLLLHDTTRQKRSLDLWMEQQRAVAKLQERERLARELHDSIGQVLGYISLQAQAARKWAETDCAEKTAPILDRLAEVAQEAHNDVRESILSLRTGAAPEWSFLLALRKYLDHFDHSFGIDSRLVLSGEMDEEALNSDVGVQLMRVIQEALSNASRHGGARHVEVAFVRDEDRVRISIVDDGSGFDPVVASRETGTHFGLSIMRDRMAQIGGSFRIESKPGSGTTVLLDVPYST